MTTVSRERAELMRQLSDLVSPRFAARYAESPIEHLRIAVRDCDEQAEIYRKLGLVDASKVA